MSDRHTSKYYPSSNIDDLPRQYRLRDGQVITMTYLAASDVKHVHTLATEAADHDLNVGRDEFEAVEDLEHVLALSEAFVFYNSGGLVGCLILQPSMYSTSWRKHTCDLRIITSCWLHERGGWSLLLDVGQKLVLQLGLLYDSAVVSVFLGSQSIYKQAREAGFTPSAILPNIGYTTRSRNKPQRIALLYKQLTPQAELRSIQEMNSFCNRADVFGTEEEFLEGKQLQIPYLPLIHEMKNGKTFHYRNYKKSDDKLLYDLILKSTGTGDGYSIDEYPTINCFRNYDLIESYCAVMEDLHTGCVVGYIIFGSSRLSRSSDKFLLGDVAMYVEPEQRGNGFGPEITNISLGMMRDVGFKAVISETFVTSPGAVVINDTLHGYNMVGFSPNCVHLHGLGWIDCIYLYRNLVTAQSFIRNIFRKGTPHPPQSRL